MAAVTFDTAKNYRLNFGKHKGKTLNEVAFDNEGLTYLAWLMDQEWINNPVNKFQEELLDNLVTFTTDPRVVKDTKAAFANRENNRK